MGADDEDDDAEDADLEELTRPPAKRQVLHPRPRGCPPEGHTACLTAGAAQLGRPGRRPELVARCLALSLAALTAAGTAVQPLRNLLQRNTVRRA